jgi:hypothetical protein
MSDHHLSRSVHRFQTFIHMLCVRISVCILKTSTTTVSYVKYESARRVKHITSIGKYLLESKRFPCTHSSLVSQESSPDSHMDQKHISKNCLWYTCQVTCLSFVCKFDYKYLHLYF